MLIYSLQYRQHQHASLSPEGIRLGLHCIFILMVSPTTYSSDAFFHLLFLLAFNISIHMSEINPKAPKNISYICMTCVQLPSSCLHTRLSFKCQRERPVVFCFSSLFFGRYALLVSCLVPTQARILFSQAEKLMESLNPQLCLFEPST